VVQLRMSGRNPSIVNRDEWRHQLRQIAMQHPTRDILDLLLSTIIPLPFYNGQPATENKRITGKYWNISK